MSLLRRQLSTSTSNNIETRDVNDFKNKTGNLYESIAIVAKRANQINVSLKEELHNMGYATAGRPLPNGVLIGGSDHGTKSSAQ